MTRSSKSAVAKKAPKPKAATASAKKTSSVSKVPSGDLTPDALLARVVKAVRGASATEHAQLVGRAAERCRNAGRADVADALIAALPKQLRADAAPDPAAVVSAALAAIQRSDSYNLQQELAKLMSGGHHAGVRSVLERLDAQGRAMLANVELKNGELAVLRDAPELALSIIDGLSGWSRDLTLEHASTLEAFATWPLATLVELAKRLGEGTVTRLGAAVAARGRVDDARALLFPEGGPPVSARTQMGRLHAVGDFAKLDAFIAAPNLQDYPWTRMRIERGVDTVAGTLATLEASPSASVMADVATMHFLAGIALERRELDAVDAILASIDRTMQRPDRIDYDVGMEAMTRSSIHDLHVQRALAGGDAARAKELLEQQLAELDDLMDTAAKNTRDPGSRVHSRASVGEALAARAGKAGHPALALKAGMKLSPAEREARAARVAGYFLPGDPGGAVEAFQAMTGKNADRYWLDPFFVELWSAVVTRPLQAELRKRSGEA